MHKTDSPSAGMIDQCLPCLACGYDLRSVKVSGLCPECGAAARDALAGLSMESVPVLRDLRRALRVIFWGILIVGPSAAALCIGAMALLATDPSMLLLMVVPWAVAAVGHLMLLDPTTALPVESGLAKVLGAASTGLGLSLAGCVLVIMSGSDRLSDFFTLVCATLLVFCWPVRNLISGRLLRKILRRTPAPERKHAIYLARFIRVATWIVAAVFSVLWGMVIIGYFDIFGLRRTVESLVDQAIMAFMPLAFLPHLTAIMAVAANLLYGCFVLIAERRVGGALRIAQARTGPVVVPCTTEQD